MSVWHDLFLSQCHPGSFACTASGLSTLHSLPNIPSMTAGKEKNDLLLAEICHCTKRQVRYSHKVSHARTQRLTFIDATSHLAATDRKLFALSFAVGRQTRMESSMSKYVGSKLINHLKPTLTAWVCKMPWDQSASSWEKEGEEMAEKRCLTFAQRGSFCLHGFQNVFNGLFWRWTCDVEPKAWMFLPGI